MNLETAEFIATPRGQATGRWIFPVVPGTPRELVQAEVAKRLTGSGQASALDDLDAKLLYPTAPWAYPVTQDNPPIGPDGWTPVTAQNEPPPRPQPPAAPSAQTPLPNVRPQLGTPQAVGSELDVLLSQWATRHGLSSAEQYFYLASYLAHHARTLVALERQPRNSRNG